MAGRIGRYHRVSAQIVSYSKHKNKFDLRSHLYYSVVDL